MRIIHTVCRITTWMWIFQGNSDSKPSSKRSLRRLEDRIKAGRGGLENCTVTSENILAKMEARLYQFPVIRGESHAHLGHCDGRQCWKQRALSPRKQLANGRVTAELTKALTLQFFLLLPVPHDEVACPHPRASSQDALWVYSGLSQAWPCFIQISVQVSLLHTWPCLRHNSYLHPHWNVVESQKITACPCLLSYINQAGGECL